MMKGFLSQFSAVLWSLPAPEEQKRAPDLLLGSSSVAKTSWHLILFRTSIPPLEHSQFLKNIQLHIVNLPMLAFSLLDPHSTILTVQLLFSNYHALPGPLKVQFLYLPDFRIDLRILSSTGLNHPLAFGHSFPTSSLLPVALHLCLLQVPDDYWKHLSF
ncbi:hypothetical protein V8G54_029504 [Vigna mungo]|uniref:Uncharacterized protein n=1 Tax=Vigna mungo TaxID=3915 RepID=A0AAQ3RJ83_VIGMU